MIRKVIAVLGIVALAGCSAIYRNHGYVPSEEDLAQLTVGIDTRDSVAEAVGTPSAGGVLNASGYYYVQSRVRHYAYQRPQVVEREVLAISFDDKGVLRNIERFGLEDGQVVPLARRVTDNTAQGSGLLRQLLTNLTNFNPGAFLN